MELSAEYFTEIVGSLTIEPGPELRPDQRRQPRAGILAEASIIPLVESSGPSAMTIQVRDLSAAGIGFLNRRKLGLDEQFALVLPRGNDTPAIVLCAVAFWQPLAADLYAIGARFTRILRDGGITPLPVEIQYPDYQPLPAEPLRKAS